MAFIRNKHHIKVGDWVKSLVEFQIPEGTFTVGHKFKVTKISPDRQGECYHLTDDMGMQVTTDSSKDVELSSPPGHEGGNMWDR
jgi:hypothetical protein